MTTSLNLPPGLMTAQPAETVADPYTFDHIPGIGELLPQFKGLPGYQYLQCTVQNQKRAQSESWQPVNNSVIYTIIGPRGQADMALMVRGKRIPGQAPNSGARLCFCDKSVQEITGLWINPHQHLEEAGEESETERDLGPAAYTKESTEIAEPGLAPGQKVWRSGA